jgi:hypothetical protein
MDARSFTERDRDTCKDATLGRVIFCRGIVCWKYSTVQEYEEERAL